MATLRRRLPAPRARALGAAAGVARRHRRPPRRGQDGATGWGRRRSSASSSELGGDRAPALTSAGGGSPVKTRDRAPLAGARRVRPRAAPARPAVPAPPLRAVGHLQPLPEPDRAGAAAAVGRHPPAAGPARCTSRPRRFTCGPACSTTSAAARPTTWSRPSAGRPTSTTTTSGRSSTSTSRSGPSGRLVSSGLCGQRIAPPGRSGAGLGTPHGAGPAGTGPAGSGPAGDGPLEEAGPAPVEAPAPAEEAILRAVPRRRGRGIPVRRSAVEASGAQAGRHLAPHVAADPARLGRRRWHERLRPGAGGGAGPGRRVL